MQTSEKLNELIPALAKARLTFGDIKKSKTNPAFRSTYAALDDIFPAIDTALAENDLVLLGGLENTEPGRICIITRLMHKSEQYIESRVTQSYNPARIQELGSVVTY